MNTAESFKNHQAGVLHKLFQTRNQEEIIEQHSLALMELLTGSIKIKIHIQVLNELCDWVSVGVRLLQTKYNRW